MMLVVDPQEKIYRNLANDGGSRFIQSNPRTPRQATTDPVFNYGQVISCSFGPAAQTPDFSYFSADLRAAYSGKVSAHVRRFCFLNLQRPGNPAAMILFDDLTAAKPEFKKSWQLTTLRPPQPTTDGVRLWNETAGGATGRLDVRLLLPAGADRTLDILSGADVHRVDGKQFTPPSTSAPEANGHRILVSPAKARSRDRFLSVLQACDAEPLPVAFEEAGGVMLVRIADRVVALPAGPDLIEQSFDVTVPSEVGAVQVLLAGLKAGAWSIATPGAPDQEAPVAPGKNTAHFTSRGGRHRITPIAGR
jgi:heparin/heparan-sulfate lyase